MPPLKTKIEQHIFDTKDLSNEDIRVMIYAWLCEKMSTTKFHKYYYKIYVGFWLISYVRSVVESSQFLNMENISEWPVKGPGSEHIIRIEWKEPVTGLNGVFLIDTRKNSNRVPQIKKVIYNNPATIIFWADGTKTVVQCQPEDEYDPEKGLVMAIAKKALGNTSRKLNDVLHKWEKIERKCKNCKYYSKPIHSKSCKQCLPVKPHTNWKPKEESDGSSGT